MDAGDLRLLVTGTVGDGGMMGSRCAVGPLHSRSKSLFWLTVWFIAGLLLVAGLWLARPSTVGAAPATSLTVACASGEAGLQAAFASAQPNAPLTINIDRPNCLMPVNNGLVMGAGLTITLNGRGLTLNGAGGPSALSILTMNDTTSPSTLTVNDTTLEHADEGIFEPAAGSGTAQGTVNFNRGTIQDMTDNAIESQYCNVDRSAFTGNGTGVGCFYAQVTRSTINGNTYGLDGWVSVVSDSVVSGNQWGFYVYRATVTNSSIVNNDYGVLIDIYDPETYGVSTITDSTISGNTTVGIFVFEERLDDLSSPVAVSVVRSRVSHNGVGIADGPAATLGDFPLNASCSSQPNILAVSQTLVDHNSGNGIKVCDFMTVSGSTISDNGGNAVAAAVATITDSTISGNSAGVNARGNATIALTTIAGNQGYGVLSSNAIILTGVILAGNDGPNCRGGSEAPVQIDNGGNLATDSTCHFRQGTSAENVNIADLHLGSLANNGGIKAGASGSQQTLPTMELGPNSLALDRLTANNADQCLDANGQVVTDPVTGSAITTDERGVARPQGTGCDSGAYEAGDQLFVLPGSTDVVRAGFFALIRVKALDTAGRNVSGRGLPVASVELDGPDGQVVAFSYPFQFGRFGGTPGYQLAINTRNLAPGDWTLIVQTGSGKNASLSSVVFTVR